MVQKKSPGWRQPHVCRGFGNKPVSFAHVWFFGTHSFSAHCASGITESFVIHPQLTFWKEPPTHPLHLINGRFHFYHDHKHNRHLMCA